MSSAQVSVGELNVKAASSLELGSGHQRPNMPNLYSGSPPCLRHPVAKRCLSHALADRTLKPALETGGAGQARGQQPGWPSRAPLCREHVRVGMEGARPQVQG